MSGESNPSVAAAATPSPFNVASLLNKPSGRAVGGTMVDRAMDAVMPMPDFATDPTGWTSQMKAQMWKALEAKGIVNTTNVNDLMRLALRDGKPGDKRSVFRCLYRHRRAFERKVAAGKAQRDFEKTVERWLVSDCTIPSENVRMLMKKAEITNAARPIAERLIDITMQAVDYQFNGHRQHAKHWAADATNETLVNLWRRVHEVGNRDGWTYQERISKLNNALGGVYSVYAYPGTLQQAVAAFEEAFGDGEKPIEPPQAEEKMTSPAAVAAPAKTSGNRFAVFFESFNNICKLNGIAEDKAVRDAIRHRAAKKLYNVDSFENLPDDANMGNLLREIKAELADPEKVEDYFGRPKITDQKPANEAKQDVPAIPIASPIPTRELVPQTAPVLGIANPMSEAAFVVLINLIAPWGAELKFTVRSMTAESLADQVETLIKTFEARGYTTQRAASPAPAAQQPAMPQQPAPAPQGNNSGTATCVMIKVGTSFNGSKPQLEFECDGYEHPLRRTAANVNLLAQLLNRVTQINGAPFNAADLTAGRKFPGMWFIDWQEAMGSDEKLHRNVMAVRSATQANAA